VTARVLEGWSFADTWEAIADAHPDYLAQSHGERRFTWKQFDERADRIARALLDAGVSHQGKVAIYLYNCPEYLESVFASFKAGAVPVNTNYRYCEEELVYLWENADVEAVVFDSAFQGMCDKLRRRLPHIRCWIRVSLGGSDTAKSAAPEWVIPCVECTASAPPGRIRASWGRSGEDLLLLYTGGTTGMPRGVMWSQDRLFRFLEFQSGRHHPATTDIGAFAVSLSKPGPKVAPAAPLMHGAGMLFSLSALNRAGSVVTLTERSFRAESLLDALASEQVNGTILVGDAFAKPFVDALDNNPGRWAVPRLNVILSTGAVLSTRSKERILAHFPQVLIVDALGSSETGSIAKRTSSSASNATAFALGPNSRVIGEDGQEVSPVAGRTGRLAVSGYIPLGYYKDPVKTSEAFVIVNGEEFAFTGDWVQCCDIEGSVRLLGRGSTCINTGGEKVFAEEVEEVLETHPLVADTVVLGVPDQRFGETVTAVVQLVPGAECAADALAEHVRTKLAGYKAPRHVVFVDDLGRAPNGKINHQEVKAMAINEIRRCLLTER
jgi:acyl-CoA synthetase (AMP-forming)/AMP-acid ligase II